MGSETTVGWPARSSFLAGFLRLPSRHVIEIPPVRPAPAILPPYRSQTRGISQKNSLSIPDYM
jgi:hypothetical protein